MVSGSLDFVSGPQNSQEGKLGADVVEWWKAVCLVTAEMRVMSWQKVEAVC